LAQGFSPASSVRSPIGCHGRAPSFFSSVMAAVMAARDIEVAAPEQLQEQPTLSDKSSEADGESQQLDVEAEAQLPPQRLILVVMVCMIQGYTLIGPLQHAFKVQMKIGDTGDVAHVFTQAAALVQWGKFAMTLGQNVLLACLCPMQRVFLAMMGMMLGCLIPPFFVYAVGSTWLGWVFISFGLIGLSLGIFECTFLNVITPLGPLTKSYAIMGFPAAFAIVNVIGMSIVSFGVPVQALFWYILVCLPLADWQSSPGTSCPSSWGVAAKAMLRARHRSTSRPSSGTPSRAARCGSRS